MQDIKLFQESSGLFDIDVEDGVFASVDGLETSIEVSLFTDARAPGSLVPDAIDRRGWVGNIITAIDNRQIGSLLWLLDQARLTSRTISSADIYARQATLHYLEDSVAEDIAVTVERGQKQISISTDIKVSDNNTQRYNSLWRNTNAFGVSDI